MMSTRRNFSTLLLTGILAVSLTHVACTTPSWASEAESIAGVVVDAAGAAVSVADPAAGPLISEIEKGFGAVVSALQDAQASQSTSTLAQVTAAMNTANQDISALEVAVKNPNTSAEISAFAAICVAAFNQISQLIPTSATSLSVALSNPNTRIAKTSAKQFKQQFKNAFKGDKNWHPTWHKYGTR